MVDYVSRVVLLLFKFHYSDIRQIAIPLIIIETITDHKLILHLEARIIHMYIIHNTPLRLVQERTQAYTGRLSFIEDLEKVALKVPPAAWRLAESFWPGPLTMILPKKPELPPETTGGLDTVAVRFPSNRIAQALIEAGGGFIAAPSANRSGRPSPTLARYCREDLDGRVDMIIDGGKVGLGLESTIIDLTEETPVILRPGFITWENLSGLLGDVDAGSLVPGLDDDTAPKAPGMKYRHYAPKGTLTVVDGTREAVTAYVNDRIRRCRASGIRTGVICTDETKDRYEADIVRSAGSRQDREAVAGELFRILREFDDEGAEEIYAEAFDTSGVGRAVMNRLLKAAGSRIVHV